MWAALKSSLLIGNDLRILSASTLTILNNPAIIAISQDPMGRSAIRISRDLNVAKDKYGVGETQIWSGHLYGGDQVVIFLNAADETMQMSTSLEDIFVAHGPGGSAPGIKETWEVYDLWANRMDEEVAQSILDAPTEALEKTLKKANWYNSTALSYKDGLKSGDARLLGKKISTIKPAGTLNATVPRHGAQVFRLRNAKRGGWTNSFYKDEL